MLAEAARQREEELITQTVEMWKRQADAARDIAVLALGHIKAEGFDSTASAVAAIKWAQEEERKTRGAEAFLTKVKNASNEDLVNMVKELMERKNANDEIVDVLPELAEPDDP